MRKDLERQIREINDEIESAEYIEAKAERCVRREKPGPDLDLAEKQLRSIVCTLDSLRRELFRLKRRLLREPVEPRPAVNFLGIEAVDKAKRTAA